MRLPPPTLREPEAEEEAEAAAEVEEAGEGAMVGARRD